MLRRGLLSVGSRYSNLLFKPPRTMTSAPAYIITLPCTDSGGRNVGQEEIL